MPYTFAHFKIRPLVFCNYLEFTEPQFDRIALQPATFFFTLLHKKTKYHVLPVEYGTIRRILFFENYITVFLNSFFEHCTFFGNIFSFFKDLHGFFRVNGTVVSEITLVLLNVTVLPIWHSKETTTGQWLLQQAHRTTQVQLRCGTVVRDNSPYPKFRKSLLSC